MTAAPPVELHVASEDKYGHAIGGAVLGLAAFGVVERAAPKLPRWQRLALELAAPIAAGLAKEALDRHRGGDFDLRDAAATAAGGGLALSLTWSRRF